MQIIKVRKHRWVMVQYILYIDTPSFVENFHLLYNFARVYCIYFYRHTLPLLKRNNDIKHRCVIVQICWGSNSTQFHILLRKLTKSNISLIVSLKNKSYGRSVTFGLRTFNSSWNKFLSKESPQSKQMTE